MISIKDRNRTKIDPILQCSRLELRANDNLKQYRDGIDKRYILGAVYVERRVAAAPGP